MDHAFESLRGQSRPAGATTAFGREPAAAGARRRRVAARPGACPTLLALLVALRAVLVPDDLPRLTSVQLTWSDLWPARPRARRASALAGYRRLAAATRAAVPPHVGARARTP